MIRLLCAPLSGFYSSRFDYRWLLLTISHVNCHKKSDISKKITIHTTKMTNSTGHCSKRASRFFFRIESFTSWERDLWNLAKSGKTRNEIPWKRFWCCLYRLPLWSGDTGAWKCSSWQFYIFESRKTEDLGQSKDKRMLLQPKPKETNIIIINNNMMIQHVIEPGGEEVEEDKLLDIFQAWWVSSEPWAQSANLFDFPGEQRKWNSYPILSTLYWILMHGKCQTHPNSSIYSAMLLRVTFSFRIST